jgi:hypothetical protein
MVRRPLKPIPPLEFDELLATFRSYLQFTVIAFLLGDSTVSNREISQPEAFSSSMMEVSLKGEERSSICV